ncbi:Copper amine oxidase N-terminal domain-containing protein [Oscillibacter sp. PC13]|uniref:copper amine oxidase N-terminal domain-containing protein n=1 Tax=Oscillibacter sp. PC13 TaxID=1855299 RepID=UPI0008F31754|nr:copper amine oxidase N-terminal domain-containing protein [Oscillibacter sp. PC13]SFP93078.1 Copper amine oxidase N-terminal domain-containing protein [Oscillibacter sp. PC13]
MKRIFSLALSLILALSLAIPALAAEDLTPPLWQEYGYSSREECIAYMYGGDETAYQADVEERLDREQWEKTTMADQIASFDADAYWESGDCWFSYYYDSKEAFMEEWLLDTDEQFRDTLLEDWLDEQWQAYRQSTLIARTRAALGTVPGQIGVMLDGTYIQFSGAVPEVKDGRTMVPCGPVLQAFGGIVSHEGGEVICTMSGTIYHLRSGSDTISVTTADGASSSVIELGAACYEKGGSTYMPLRPFAEAMGCDVIWDSAFQTAVLLQRDALVSQLDQDFTVLNRMLEAMELDASKNYKTAVGLDANLTMLDSISGDKTYHMDADLDLLQSGTAFNLTAKMDLAALMEIDGITDGLTAAEITAMRSTLRNLKIQVIYDGEGGMLYLKMPALSLLSQGSIPSDSWFSIPTVTLEDLELDGGATVGAMLYETAVSQMSSWGSYYYDGMTTPALLYRDLTQAAAQAAAYLGDGCFRDSGGYSVLHYGEDAYNAYLESVYGEGSAEYFSEFEKLDLDLKIAQSGSATFQVLLQTKDSGYSYYYGDPVMLVDASGSVSAAKVDMKLLMKIKNQLNLDLTYTAATTETREQPATAPAAGETVVNPYEDLYGGDDVAPIPEPAA